jgi:glycosyltransferase involved in cell wall biosynthesis
MTPVPIVYFIGGATIGGQETHLLHLLAGLDRARYAPSLLTLAAAADYAARVRAQDVPLHDLGTPRLTSLPALLRVGRLPALFHRIRPAILQTYGFTCDVIGPLTACSRPAMRVITTRRGEDRVRRHQRLRSMANRVTDRVICVSEETHRFTERTETLGRARTLVIPNGVHLPQVPRRPGTGRLRFGTVGNVKPIKGTDLLLEAFLGFPDDVEAELHVAGRAESPWAQDLRDRSAGSPLADRIHFVGFEPDAASFLAGLDVFVLPSRSEGMSNALLEAMAVGLPVIATDVGSNASVLHHRQSGLEAGIVTAASAVALQAAMARLLAEGSTRDTLGRNGLELVRRFYAMPHMVAAHEQVYEELLSDRR